MIEHVWDPAGWVRNKVEVKLRSMKSDFTLYCQCGTITTYGSSKIEWKEGMILECRICKAKYYPSIYVDIVRYKKLKSLSEK